MTNHEQPSQEPHQDLYRVDIPEAMLARGGGEEVALSDVTAYDCMPKIIGNEFRTNPGLQPSLFHFAPQNSMPVRIMEEAYLKLAADLLELGELEGALEAYKRGLHQSLDFITMVHGMQRMALLTSAEVQYLDVVGKYASIEQDLGLAVIGRSESAAYDEQEYPQFLAGIRHTLAEENRLGNEYATCRKFEYVGWGKPSKAVAFAASAAQYVMRLEASQSYEDARHCAAAIGWEEKAQEMELKAANFKPVLDPELERAYIYRATPQSYWDY